MYVSALAATSTRTLQTSKDALRHFAAVSLSIYVVLIGFFGVWRVGGLLNLLSPKETHQKASLAPPEEGRGTLFEPDCDHFGNISEDCSISIGFVMFASGFCLYISCFKPAAAEIRLWYFLFQWPTLEKKRHSEQKCQYFKCNVFVYTYIYPVYIIG